MLRRSFIVTAVLMVLVPLLTAVAGRGVLAQDASPAAMQPDPSISGTISVGMVGNPQMVALQEMLPEFNQLYPNITVNMTVLPENEIRQTITQDITNQSG